MKVVPYSTPTGARADLVSRQLACTLLSHKPRSRLPLLTAITGNYLPSCRAPSPFGRYQIILLGDEGTFVKDLLRVVTWEWNNGWELNLRPSPQHTDDLSSSEDETPDLPCSEWCHCHLWAAERSDRRPVHQHRSHDVHRLSETVYHLVSPHCCWTTGTPA